jgi:lipid II:glycine glycyltransferase (peptidoglycan interpeptide bridge formation enzyme)
MAGRLPKGPGRRQWTTLLAQLGRRRRGGTDGDGREHGGPAVVVMVSAEPDPAALREWDRLVDAIPGSDVAQLSAWARIRGDAGFRPLFLFAHSDGQLVGGALVLEYRLPVGGRLGYVSGGPLVSPAVSREPVVDRLVSAMNVLARTRLHALFVQPPGDGQDMSAGLYEQGFRPSTAGIAPAASIRIDLRCETEELHGRMSKANRRRARNWAQRGVTVRVGSPDDAPLVADLLARTAEHQQFEPFSLGYVQRLYQELDVGRHVVVFIAEIDSSPVAALLCTRCNGTVKQRISGMKRTERARRDGVSAATVWHAMLWAKSHGYGTYDFGGLRADVARSLLAGHPQPRPQLTGSEQFKMSFGGEVFLYPDQVEFISSAPLRLAYDIARRTSTGGRIVDIGKRALRSGRSLSRLCVPSSCAGSQRARSASSRSRNSIQRLRFRIR